jgi:hypothetical protein
MSGGAQAQESGREERNRRAERESLSLALIRDSLRGLRFGTVTVVVQDGVAVQVERNEKIRIVRPGGGFREGEGI